MSFYIYLPWDGSSHYFKDNTTSNFKVKLPEILKLNSRLMEIALVEVINFPVCDLTSSSVSRSESSNYIVKNKFRQQEEGKLYNAFIRCDVIQPQIYGSSFMNLLRILSINSHEPSKHLSFESPFYIPIDRKEMNSIQIQICDETGSCLKLQSSSLDKFTLVLHVRERRKNRI